MINHRPISVTDSRCLPACLPFEANAADGNIYRREMIYSMHSSLAFSLLIFDLGADNRIPADSFARPGVSRDLAEEPDVFRHSRFDISSSIRCLTFFLPPPFPLAVHILLSAVSFASRTFYKHARERCNIFLSNSASDAANGQRGSAYTAFNFKWIPPLTGYSSEYQSAKCLQLPRRKRASTRNQILPPRRRPNRSFIKGNVSAAVFPNLSGTPCIHIVFQIALSASQGETP